MLAFHNVLFKGGLCSDAASSTQLGALSGLTSLALVLCEALWGGGKQDRPDCPLPAAHALLLLMSWMVPVLMPGQHHGLSVHG